MHWNKMLNFIFKTLAYVALRPHNYLTRSPLLHRTTHTSGTLCTLVTDNDCMAMTRLNGNHFQTYLLIHTQRKLIMKSNLTFNKLSRKKITNRKKKSMSESLISASHLFLSIEISNLKAPGQRVIYSVEIESVS